MIKVHNTSKYYQNGDVINYALQDVNLSIDQGEFIVFAGPSGSGKTTLLNVIGSLDTPSSGSIIIDGQDITKKSGSALAKFRLENLGFIFQSYNLFPVLNVFENVAMPLELKLLPKAQIKDMVYQVLSDVSMLEYVQRKPNELSGGQQQRVAVARALVSTPKLIIADEPTANLDSANSQALIMLMRTMKDKYHNTILASSHDPLVISCAERVVFLKDGQIDQIKVNT